MGLGDAIEQALAVVGVNQDRVERWLGVPCNCRVRKEKLNMLGRWAKRVATGRVDKAAVYLERLMRR